MVFPDNDLIDGRGHEASPFENGLFAVTYLDVCGPQRHPRMVTIFTNDSVETIHYTLLRFLDKQFY